MALSDFRISKAKPKDKPYKLGDSGGLFLLVNRNGSKLWRQKYRYMGKERLLSHGQYPDVTLAQARKKRDEARAQLADGLDPGVEKKLAQIEAEKQSHNTFKLIAEEYIGNMEERGLAPATMKKKRWILLDLAQPLHNRPINKISSAEVLYLLKSIEKSGRRETAKKMRSELSAVFRLAVVTLRSENDPTTAIKDALMPPKVTPRAAILDEKEFGQLLRRIDEYEGWPVIPAAMKFQILTCTRPGEARGTRMQEFDLDARTWTVPASRMKMRRPHSIPLSDQALNIVLENWSEIKGVDLLFPSKISNRKLLSENAFNSVLRRLGYSGKEVTAHGFRVTVSTILNSREYNPDVIEAILAHQDTNAIRRTYNRTTYWKQRVELMQIWADLCDEFRAL